jgi:DNA-binding PadR family transcriptional regulator
LLGHPATESKTDSRRNSESKRTMAVSTPNLDTPVNNGLVERGSIDRRTNYYVLSDARQQALLERREWENRFFGPDDG